MAFVLRNLSELNGVAGDEGIVRKYIINLINDKCDNITVDSMGNIIAYKKGKSSKKKIMIATNMDEAGFIVSSITDDGYIKFKPVGDIDPRTLVSKRVVIGNDNIKGIIGMKAIHLQKKSERENAVLVSALFIDIGCKSKLKAEKKVKLGDFITFDTEYKEIGSIIKGKALDRFGCACLIDAIDEAPLYDTYFVFSTQREQPGKICGRGLIAASYNIKPDIALIVNTVPASDVYNAAKHDVSATLGGGAVIEYMDRTNISNTLLTSTIKNIAKLNNIPIQDKMSSVYSSIAGAVITPSNAAIVSCIGIPCRYSHTPVCMMNKNDIDSVSKICRLFVKERETVNGITE